MIIPVQILKCYYDALKTRQGGVQIQSVGHLSYTKMCACAHVRMGAWLFSLPVYAPPGAAHH